MAIYFVNALDAVVFNDNPEHKEVLRDNVVFGDIAKINVTQTVYVRDGIKLTTKGKTVYSVNVYDEVSFTDASRLVIPCYASDTARFAEASYRHAIFTVELSDEIQVSDDTSQRADFTTSAADGAGFSTNILHVITFTANEATLTLSDSAYVSAFRVTEDTASFSDSASAKVTYAAVAEDTIDFSEAHKFATRAFASEYIRFLDNTDEVRVRGDIEDERVVISDVAAAFNRYMVQCAETINFSDYIDGNITPYIKWVNDDFIMEDDASSRADYRIRIRESIIVSDDYNARMIGYGDHAEGLGFGDKATSGVYYSSPNIATNNIMSFSDSCYVNVSTYRPITYTNSLAFGVGTSESTVYTASQSIANILNMSLCNTHSSDITISVILYKGGTTPINIRKDLPIGVGETFVINREDESSFAIEQTDEIRVISSSSTSLDVYMAIIEQ